MTRVVGCGDMPLVDEVLAPEATTGTSLRIGGLVRLTGLLEDLDARADAGGVMLTQRHNQ
jgi:hypothetical protein